MDKSKMELVCDWLTRASHDLRAARTLAAQGNQLDTAIYHCQQAGEKAIKGWLQLRDNLFPKTHDIEELVEQATQLNNDFKQLEIAAITLTPYVSAFRYPGAADEPMPTPEEFDDALRHAETIFNFVIARLPAEARPSEKN